MKTMEREEAQRAEQVYPGADSENDNIKVTEELVDEETETLNNNPRNSDL